MEIKWSRDFSIKNMQLDKQHELIFEKLPILQMI